MARKAPRPDNPDAARVAGVLVSSTVYLRHTTPSGTYVTEHRCWDPKLFIAAQFKAALDSGTGAVEQVGSEDYREWRKNGRRQSTAHA